MYGMTASQVYDDLPWLFDTRIILLVLLVGIILVGVGYRRGWWSE